MAREEQRARGETRKRAGRRVAVAVAASIFLVAGVGWWKLFRELPQRLADETAEEQFKYGSIGAEDSQGLPYWIWLVLPRIFPEYLPHPGGWASLGFAWEPGRETPVGFSKKTIGFERVAINCAFCHVARVRKAGDPTPHIYPAGPGNTVEPLAYERFLFAAASDPRFTADTVLREIAQVTRLPLLDRLIYRFLLVPATRKALLAQKARFSWTDARPNWGRGRIDPFNPIKFGILKREAYGKRSIGEIDDGSIGNSDMEPIWNLRPRVERKMAFHWDGLNTDVTEVVLSSALGDGATPKSLPVTQLKRIESYLKDLQPPKFETLFSVDHPLARKGEAIYRRQCAVCHSIDGEKTGHVLPLTDEAWSEGIDPQAPRPRFTDPHRAQMWVPQAAAAYNAYAAGREWAFSHFRSTGAYVNVPLDAIWIRAPYLHNGSVPYLTELLEMPEKRTKVFYRGLDVYDPERMGFCADASEARRSGTRYDTSVAGNSNQGHLWGTDLAPEEKGALIEYLKTL